jgi:hypothetical protein
MTAITYYVIDTRTNQIINAIESRKPEGPDLEGFQNREHLRLETRPTMAQLSAYRYWNERP